MAADLPWRPRASVPGHSLRGRVEVCGQDWQGHAGWAQLAQQPGEEGARRSVLLRLLGDPALCVHPDQEVQLTNHLPADTVGSLRAHVQGKCLVEGMEDLGSADAPHRRLHNFTQALHEVWAFGCSKQHRMQRPLGRLEPTPSLQYRADEVMRHMPALST